MGGCKRRAVAIVLALLCAAGVASAQDPAQDPAAQQAQYDQLFQQMLEQPANLDLMFQFSQVATRMGRYEPAITTLERMLIYNPDLPRVRLELGVLYLRIGAPEVARSYFIEALQTADIPEPVRARADAFLAEIDRRTARHLVAGSVFGGLRYQTNANAAPNGGRVVTPAGILELDDRFRREDDFNAFLSGLVLHRYTLDNPRGEYWESRAIAYASKQFQVEDLDLAVLQIDTGPRLALLPDLIPSTTARPYLVADAASLDWKLLFASAGAGLEVRHQVNDELLLEAEPVLLYREFDNSSTFRNVDEQSGWEAGIALRAHYRIRPDLVLRGELSYSNEDARDRSESNNEYGVAASLEYTYPAPFGLDLPPWTVALGAGYVWTDYREEDENVDRTRERRDEEFRLSLLNSFRITNSLSIEAQLQYINNDSNIRNFDRDNFIVLIGALLNF